MATTVKIKSSRNSKDRAFFQFVLDHIIHQESYPNGNSGLNDSVVRRLFTNEKAPFKSFVCKKQSGNPTTVSYIELDFTPRGLFAEFLKETQPILVHGFDVRMTVIMSYDDIEELHLRVRWEHKQEANKLLRTWFLNKYA